MACTQLCQSYAPASTLFLIVSRKGAVTFVFGAKTVPLPSQNSVTPSGNPETMKNTVVVAVPVFFYIHHIFVGSNALCAPVNCCSVKLKHVVYTCF